MAAFIWAVKRGQFDDLEGPGHRVLMDDDKVREGAKEKADNHNGHNEHNEKARELAVLAA